MEEIFSSAVDVLDARGDSDTHVQESREDDESDEVVWKEESEHHSFQDCASEEGNQRHDIRIDSNNPETDVNVMGDEYVVLDSSDVILNDSGNGESKSVISDVCDKSVEVENKQNGKLHSHKRS